MNRLSRWSRRKRGDTPETIDPTGLFSPVTNEAIDELDKATTLEGDSPDEQPLAHRPEENLAGDEDCLDDTLPAPESLEAGSDFSAYLQQGISQGLRRRALRRLFATGNYNVRDGLDDYDQDFRQQKPLSAEISARLRQWTQKLEEEASDQPESVPQEEPPVVNSDMESDEQDAAPEDDRERDEPSIDPSLMNNDQR